MSILLQNIKGLFFLESGVPVYNLDGTPESFVARKGTSPLHPNNYLLAFWTDASWRLTDYLLAR